MNFDADNRILSSSLPSDGTDFNRRRVLSVLAASAAAAGLSPLSEPAIAQAARSAVQTAGPAKVPRIMTSWLPRRAP
ncbi:MAG: hypothetical protein ACKO9D_09620, partial [Gammaproteobacteria bacterium]